MSISTPFVACRGALLAALCGGLLSAAPVHADCKLHSLVLPVRLVDARPIVDLSVNGTVLPMLLDSGAFFSTLLPATAEALNLKTLELPRRLEIHGYAGAVEARYTLVP